MNPIIQVATSKYGVAVIVASIYFLLNRYSFLGKESNPDIEINHIVVLAVMFYIGIEVFLYFSKISKSPISLRPMEMD